MNGYTLEAYCHVCCTVVVRLGPYEAIGEIVTDLEDMMERHEAKVHAVPTQGPGPLMRTPRG